MFELLVANFGVAPFVFVGDLDTTEHSVWFEHIVASYTIVAVPRYTVVVPLFVARVKTAAVL